MMKKITLTLLFAFVCRMGFAQLIENKKIIDSLKHDLVISKDDSSRAMTLMRLCLGYRSLNIDSGQFYGQEGLNLSRKIKFPKGEAWALHYLSMTQESLGNYPKALEINLIALKIAEANDLIDLKGRLLRGIGGDYIWSKDYSKALRYNREALKLFESVHDEPIIETVQRNLGEIYLQTNQLDSAAYYFQAARNQHVKYRLAFWEVESLLNLGRVQAKKGNIGTALKYLQQGRAVAYKTGYLRDICDADYATAEVFKQINQPDSCIFFAKQSLEYAQKSKFYDDIISAGSLLSEVYALQDAKQALQYNNITLAAKDSLYNLGNKNAIANLAAFDEQERQYAVQTATTAYQNTVRLYSLLAGLLVFLVIAFILYRNSRQKQKANTLLLQQKEEIMQQKEEIEAQADQALKQASMDRVRAEIASMRTTNDLERIIPLVWNELTILGIPFIRCGIFIVDEQEEVIHTHLSTPDGRALAAFDLAFDSEGIGQNVLPAWRKGQMATIHWSAEEFAASTRNLVAQGRVKSEERIVTEHPDTDLDLHFFPFLQGMLYVGNTEPLTADAKELVGSLAEAFSTAYARYEDFNKLEAAKQQVDKTLTELKAAQTQLIQTEKMASLGELTAGIAHEIQNPLNFVNNFSEVSAELLEELKQEAKHGHTEDVIEIADSLSQNLEKITHHGKRADAIVKGMLQHSQTGSSAKELVNINALADEYMRLSYHGLRAKDKSFNAELVTHYDEQLPKITAIPQDMGRVLLNLFNNAFYAVNQKAKTAGSDYKPEVSVTTSDTNGQVIFKVKDNGIGIPDAIKEKIMQPFFTTKPTGEGTGLGLSLTYDMVVKGHGGSINVNTKEGEYTEFVIVLPLS